MAATLIRTDRNGTKYYQDTTCPKCNGNGYIRGYEFVRGGVCFLCNGTGYHVTTRKEYTPEYAAKLAERRAAKKRAEAPEENRRLLARNGFNEDGETWVVLGDTYAIKDELKERGARFSYALGWHFDAPQTDYNCAVVNASDVFPVNDYGVFWMDDTEDARGKVRAICAAAMPKTETESAHVGTVGARDTFILTHCATFFFDTFYGTTFIHKFTDECGNVFVWKSSKGGDFTQGETYTITGTIKAHDEYKGVKQTALTRCKVN